MPKEIGDAMVRLTIATMKVRANRTAGQGLTDEEVLKEQGFQTFGDYWRAALHSRSTVDEFSFLFESHLLDPQRTADEYHRRKVTIKCLIKQALKAAHAAKEGLFVDGNAPFCDELILRPLPTAEWLAKSDVCRSCACSTSRVSAQ